MNLSLILWLLVWAAMYSGFYNLRSSQWLEDPFSFLQGARALLPLLAIYLCIMWIMFSRSKLLTPFKTPLGLLFGYCIVGIAASFFSPDNLRALYWGALYLSPLLAVWVISTKNNSLDNLRRIIYFNYLLAIIVMCAVLPEALRFGLVRNQIYILPFDIGIIRANGVGRFALLITIISSVRLTTQTKGQNWFWLILLVPALYLLLQTQSRSSLVGLAIAGILIVYLKGMDWRFIFTGPILAYLIWLSGFQLRARGQIEELFFLTGREHVWRKGIELLAQSPIFGCGFHADRIMLKFQHMHNSYFHALVQSGIVGVLFFIGALIGIWSLIIRNNLLKRVRNVRGSDQALLIESLIFLAFLTFRTLVESTGAFYGVDLLLLVPLIGYIQLWNRKNITKSAVR